MLPHRGLPSFQKICNCQLPLCKLLLVFSPHTDRSLTALQNIVHRDIKPENIFIMADGSVRLADFGLAGDASVTDRRLCVGTLDYIAPEVEWRSQALIILISSIRHFLRGPNDCTQSFALQTQALLTYLHTYLYDRMLLLQQANTGGFLHRHKCSYHSNGWDLCAGACPQSTTSRSFKAHNWD